MKTPDEIKKGLEICSSRGDCAKCPYPEGECFSDLVEKDAHGYILQLENHIGELTEKVAQLEAAQPKWISVEERLPDEGVKVLTLDRYGHVQDRFLYAFQGGPIVFRPDGMFPKKHVTHWMPMLELPG